MKTVVFCLATLFILPALAEVKITPSKDRIAVEIDGKPFGDFIYGADVWKPYLWPLRSASDKIVVRQYPMSKSVAGETHDHNHHRGLWFGHGDVNGYDFWSADPLNKQSSKYGKVVVTKVDKANGGKDSGMFTVAMEWKDPSGKTIATESRTMTFWSDPKLRIVDVDLTITPKEKLVFGDTKEGTFGIRLATSLQEDKGGHMVNAEGAEGEKNVWGKPSNWVDYYGSVDGENLGVAILDHPENPRHPVRWHSRAYGLFAANPFGLAEFVKDKSKNGALTAEPGKTLRFRYRVVIHPGGVKDADLGGMYQKWVK